MAHAQATTLDLAQAAIASRTIATNIRRSLEQKRLRSIRREQTHRMHRLHASFLALIAPVFIVKLDSRILRSHDIRADGINVLLGLRELDHIRVRQTHARGIPISAEDLRYAATHVRYVGRRRTNHRDIDLIARHPRGPQILICAKFVSGFTSTSGEDEIWISSSRNIYEPELRKLLLQGRFKPVYGSAA